MTSELEFKTACLTAHPFINQKGNTVWVDRTDYTQELPIVYFHDENDTARALDKETFKESFSLVFPMSHRPTDPRNVNAARAMGIIK